MSDDMEMEDMLAAADRSTLDIEKRPGNLVGFVCPECKGPLWEIRDGELINYRCRVGHSITAGSMLAGQGEAVEDALWTALNILQESMQLSEQLAAEARTQGHRMVAQRMDEKVQAKRRQVETLRAVLANGGQALDTASTIDPGATGDPNNEDYSPEPPEPVSGQPA